MLLQTPHLSLIIAKSWLCIRLVLKVIIVSLVIHRKYNSTGFYHFQTTKLKIVAHEIYKWQNPTEGCIPWAKQYTRQDDEKIIRINLSVTFILRKWFTNLHLKPSWWTSQSSLGVFGNCSGQNDVISSHSGWPERVVVHFKSPVTTLMSNKITVSRVKLCLLTSHFLSKALLKTTGENLCHQEKSLIAVFYDKRPHCH